MTEAEFNEQVEEALLRIDNAIQQLRSEIRKGELYPNVDGPNHFLVMLDNMATDLEDL